MGQFFFMWVLVPVLLGVLIAGRVSEAVTLRIVPVARRLSFFILILLNYLNGAACLPALAWQPQLLAWPLIGAASLFLVSLALSQFLARQCVIAEPAAESSTSVSLMLAVVMRNTGAALVFAGAALPDYASVSLTIIAYTMLQHVGVGFLLGRAGPRTNPLVLKH